MDIFPNYTAIKLAVILQNYYRNIKNKKELLTKNLRKYYEFSYLLMSHIQITYEKNIFSKSVYNSNMDDLDNILVFYKFIKKKLNLTRLSIYKIVQLEIFTDILKDRLINLTEIIGCSSIIDIINLTLNADVMSTIKNHHNSLNFYNKFFIATSIKSRELKKKTANHNIIINIKRNTKYSNSNSVSFIQKISGATLLIEVLNTTFIIQGCFKKDPLNIIRLEGKLHDKYNDLRKDFNTLDVPIDFKERYVEQLSLRDFIVLTVPEIYSTITKSYNELKKYKSKTLSLLIKEFIKCSAEKQRHILTLFLISNEEDQFLAHVIYDMISNQTTIYQNQPIAEVIYSSMHWSVQKLFKNAIKEAENKKRKLQNFSEDDISYEKRLTLMKTSDSVKKKGFDKLKDLNGGKESSAKAMQYIDALLKIPFDTYQKEAILSFIDDYSELLKSKMNYIEISINNISNTVIQDSLENLLDFYNDNDLNTDQTITILIKKCFYALNNISIISGLQLRLFKLDEIKILNLDLSDYKNIKIIENVKSNNIEVDKKNNLLFDNEESDCISDMDDISETDYDSESSPPVIQQKDITNIIKNKSKIPNMLTIKESIEKIKKIQNLKDILIEGNNISENTIQIMQKQLSEIQDNIGFSNIKDEIDLSENKKISSPKSLDELNNKVKSNSFDVDMEYEELEKLYLEMFNIIEKWIKYKVEKINYLKNVNNILDNCIHGHKDAKKQISRLIGQWMNGSITGACIGFCGPPGIGKTSICKNGLSKCLIDADGKERPIAFLPLGGTSNGPLLEGHHYTYLGSTWGKIVDILISTKCMNPIIYIDELDKVSKTENGKEILSILTHLTDPTQNMEFNDRYFAGIPLDLSKAIFVFSYNDASLVDKILRDRIHEINVKALSKNEKIKITKKYLLPDILKMIGLKDGDIIIKNKDIEFLIENYTYEAGVRKLNEHLVILLREINLMLIMEDESIKIPYRIKTEFIKQVFSEKQLIKVKKIFNKPHIGLVNGLYATTVGLGGITIIEVLKNHSAQSLSLHLTGMQGDVMKESMHCAKTLAWNLIPNSVKKDVKKDWEDNGIWGLHIHCPEGATPKDGPSAGSAITIAIISQLCKISVKNNIAITGEIDLNGNVGQVGGISSKIDGGIKAGVNTIFIPKDNEDDYNKYLKQKKETLVSSDEFSCDSDDEENKKDTKKKLKVILVSRIEEIINKVFTKKIKFNKIH